jgi:Escherichia/Staphylococcus phage prohead protease
MTKREIERRYFAQPVEFRAATDGGMGKLGGYASMFNSTSQNLGGFVEQVSPTAFNKTLGDGVRILCRTHHMDEWLLGTTEAETLRVEVDGTGLVYEVDLPDTQAGRDTQALAQRTDLRYSSFAFRCIEDEWDITPDGFPIRTLIQVQLVDVAPVVSPAYMDSSVGMRSLAERLDIDPATIGGVAVEEIRGLLLGSIITDPPEADGKFIAEPATQLHEDRDGPRDTHPLTTIRAMRLALDAKR